jgi:UDP-GlcNAc:undecaprenyl-phosphate GlcNAc-1-phosphate transferase
MDLVGRDDLIIFLIVTFGVAFAFSSLFTALSIGLWWRFKLMGKSSSENVPPRPRPGLGGPAIWLALMVSLILSSRAWPQHVAILMGGALIMLVGVMDEVRGVNAIVKLLSLAVATGIVWAQAPAASTAAGAAASYAVMLVWTVAVVSAMKAIDTMDGLAVGISLVASCMFMVAALQAEQVVFAVMSAALAGALMGFLVFNRPPAQIALGGSGALLLGYILASAGMLGTWSANPVKATLVPVLILGVPLVNLGFVALVRRLRRVTQDAGESAVRPASDHLPHRLVGAGFTPNEAALASIALAAAGGALAVGLRSARSTEAILLAVQICVVYGLFFLLLARSARRPA